MARPLVGIFLLAATLRVGFALWAPGVPLSDGRFYHMHALVLLDTGHYLNGDGSPGIRWMPGWPAFLAALYQLFGTAPRVGMLACALLDAATAALIALLGARLFGRAVGIGAGLLYALWPGVVFYAGTLFTEPAFNLLWVATLVLLSFGRDDTRRLAPELGAGLCFGLAAYVKSEPLALAPALLFAIWRLCPRPSAFARRAAALLLVTAALVAPWTLRNWLVFGRFIPTSASGGVVVHLANQPGATGGQDFKLQRELSRRYRGDSLAETTIRRNDVGWSEARRFVREHPREAATTAVRKLRLTYGGDSQAIRTVRGTGKPAAWHLSRSAYRGLADLSNRWWWLAVSLAAIGLTSLRRWPRGAAALLLGPLLTFFTLHLVFLGGQRFHVPEVPLLALLGGHGIQQLAALARRLRPPAQPSSTSKRST
jgi:4-amino-4-deoxy-L-arabinose transferase-like glycosyltransferase